MAGGGYTANVPAQQAYLVGPRGVATGLVGRLLRSARNEAVVRAPVRFGNLRNSITTTGPRARGLVVSGTVEARVRYALPVHEGSRPHVIRAKPGGVLAFPGRSGGVVFARSVQHPGAKGQPFLTRGLRTAANRSRTPWVVT